MRKYLILICLALYGAGLAGALAPLLPAPEKRQLVEMLEAAGLEEASLRFEKDWDLSTRFKLDWQLGQLQDPWKAFDDLQALREACVVGDSLPGSLPRLLQQLGGIAFNLGAEPCAGLYLDCYTSYRDDLRGVSKPEFLARWLDSGLVPLEAKLDQALGGRDKLVLNQLASFWLWQFIEGEDAEKYTDYFRRQGYPPYDSLDSKDIYRRLEGLDLAALLDAGIRYRALADAVVEAASRLRYPDKKPLLLETRQGLMVFGTRGDDVYDGRLTKGRDPILILEPGGNDAYEIDLKTGSGKPFYLLADLSANDLYPGDEPGSLFCGAFGCGFSYDLAGDDVYQTDDFAFSAFAGINVHEDRAGADFYRSGLFSQGAAMFGLGILLDHGGNDIYQASVSAQAIGSTHGVGALLDQAGADSYLIGGKYFHEPLMPLDHITLGQGMGMGLRPELAGGLGLLYDGGGNDRYLGGVYAQGSGYWYATGALLDEGGNDVYNTVYYPQGSGIHLACGFLMDASGDDAYYSRMGPGQGAGHDWALGMLIDGGGNDAYSIDGGNGLGLTNSVGIFVDRSGDDRYERVNSQSYGHANPARSTGGIGLFLDAGGKDVYPDSLKANDKTWQSGTFGIGRDVNLNLIARTAVEELAETAALPDSTDSIEAIFAAASEWEVGSAVQRVKKAREILLSREGEAVEYVVQNKLATDSGLEYRALEALAKSSQAFRSRLFPVIEGADSLAAKNSLALVAGVGDTLLVDVIGRLLAAKRYETACLSALAGVDSPLAVNILRDYIGHPSERFRYITARSLLQNKDPLARTTLYLMREDHSFLVQALLRGLPAE